MKKLSSHDRQRNTAQVLDTALKAPVTISYHDYDRLVILSIDEFERLKRRDKTVTAIEDVPANFLLALREPYFAPEQAALDHLLDE